MHVALCRSVSHNGAMDYKSNRNVVFSCNYHVVFCPKYRRKVLVGNVESRLKAIVDEVALETETDILEMEVMADHVHLLVGVDPQFGVHRFVKRVKGRSARDLRADFKSLRTRLPTLWTNSYFVSTVGGAPLAAVGQYIESQKRSEPRKKRNA